MKDRNTNQPNKTNGSEMLFGKDNFVLIAVSLAIVVIGFFLMSGTEGDIYDFRRTTLAPAVVILGFGLGIYAIFYRKK
jgi:peptidoglycan/LPS O-acetylase OafA/YrhL